VAQEVECSVIASDLEVSVVRAEPAVDHLDDLGAPAVDLEALRDRDRLAAARLAAEGVAIGRPGTGGERLLEGSLEESSNS
jgi:hypothetical protein